MIYGGQNHAVHNRSSWPVSDEKFARHASEHRSRSNRTVLSKVLVDRIGEMMDAGDDVSPETLASMFGLTLQGAGMYITRATIS